MHQPDDAHLPRSTTSPPAVATQPVDGANARALQAHAEQGGLAPEPYWLALVEDTLGPFLPADRAAWRARWTRRAVWAALTTLLVLLPIAQWGSSTDQLYAAAAAARTSWRYDRALADYATLARLHPSDPRPHCLQGQVLALQQLYVQAQAAYNACEQRGDNSPDTWLAQGDAANSGGQLQASERDWLRAVAIGSRTAHRRLALLYEQEGRLAEAETQWRALGPDDSQAQEHLGLLALQAGNYTAASAAFVAARSLPGEYGQDAVDGGFVTLAALPPTDAAGFAALGADFVQANMLPLARKPLETSLALDPSYGPAHAYLAWVLLAAGQVASAQTEAAQAVREAPALSFGWFVAAEVALSDQRWTDAIKDLQSGLAHDKANPVLWAALAPAYVGVDDYINAELSLSTAAQLAAEPEFTIDLLRFYVAHSLSGFQDRGSAAASTALRRFPMNAQIVSLAGQVYEEVKDLDQAYAAYLRANALDPSLPDPYFYLGRLALSEGDYVQGDLELSTYLALRPSGDLAVQARTLLHPYVWFNL